MHEGRLLFSGPVAGLFGAEKAQYDVQVKDGGERLRVALAQAGCDVLPNADGLVVTLPEGQDADLIWRQAVTVKVQVRHLQRQRATLESAFLNALES